MKSPRLVREGPPAQIHSPFRISNVRTGPSLALHSSNDKILQYRHLQFWTPQADQSTNDMSPIFVDFCINATPCYCCRRKPHFRSYHARWDRLQLHPTKLTALESAAKHAEPFPSNQRMQNSSVNAGIPPLSIIPYRILYSSMPHQHKILVVTAAHCILIFIY